MRVTRHGRSLVFVCSLALPALVQAAETTATTPTLSAAGGIVQVVFTTPAGKATAFLPDDIAAGEPFSGTFEAPAGYVLMQGRQKAKANQTFSWTVPATGAEAMPLVVRDGRGAEVGSLVLRTPKAGAPETAFRVPAMIQSGRPFPVHGPFDGRAGTTKVHVGQRQAVVIVESRRRAVLRAPAGVVGTTRAAVRESGQRFDGQTRSLGLEVTPDDPSAGRVERAITIRGLAGATRDIPIEMGASAMYVRHEEVSPEGVFTATRTFRTLEGQDPITLVIPASRKEEVAVVLRTPSRDRAVKLARQHAQVLKSLEFDALPVIRELLNDFQLGGDAAFAAFEVDEARALPMVLGAVPNVGTGVEVIALDYYIGRSAEVRAAAADDARAAARRVLSRILSTATAELATYVLGLVGTPEDVPQLETLAARVSMGSKSLSDAAEASLARMGKRPYLDRIHGELGRTLTRASRYDDGAAVTKALRKAAFSGKAEMIGDACAHVDDPRIGDSDFFVDPGDAARFALAAIVDGSPVPAPGARRSKDDWRAYCDARVR